MFDNIFIILVFSNCALAYSNGAPELACISLKPSHGERQPWIAFPFKIILSSTSVVQGEIFNFSLVSIYTAEKFKGFIIQAKDYGSSHMVNIALHGQFIESSTVNTINCSGISTTATQSSNSERNSQEITWIAPMKPMKIMFV